MCSLYIRNLCTTHSPVVGMTCSLICPIFHDIIHNYVETGYNGFCHIFLFYWIIRFDSCRFVAGVESGRPVSTQF